MAEIVVERALVPDATRSRVLVVGGDRSSLPGWRLDGFDAAESIRAAHRSLAIPSPFLRLVRSDEDPVSGATRTLLEFDAPPAGWQPPSPLAWLPFETATAAGIEAGPFGADVTAWIAQVRSGEFPARRPEWARPDWFAATVAWLSAELARLERDVTGPVEQLGAWEISSLLAADTSAGRVVLKSVPAIFGHEPALTRALAAEHPGVVPNVLAVDPSGRHLVMEAFGGKALGEEEPGRWSDGLVAMSGIHRAWVGRREAATRIGAPDRSLAALDAELESLVTDEDSSPGLDPSDRRHLIANLPRYHDLVGQLQAGPVPETLVHADFHPWNVNRDNGRLVIYDWSDACWSHPFFDVATCTVRTERAAAREAMRAAYLATWGDYGEEAVLRQALALAGPLTELHLAITWRRLRSIFEPGHPYPFVASAVQRHLQYALAATHELD